MIILIIGNSGSGKTTLAKKLSIKHKLQKFHIDELIYNPGGWTKDFWVSKNKIQEKILNIKKFNNYIIEGGSIYIIKQFINEATHLIFLNVKWEVCKKSIVNRSNNIDEQFIIWASEYYERKDNYSISLKNHQKIFDDFLRDKNIISNRKDINNLKFI